MIFEPRAGVPPTWWPMLGWATLLTDVIPENLLVSGWRFPRSPPGRERSGNA